MPENFSFPNDNLDEINNDDTHSVLEEDFFEKINGIFRKTREINPLTIMQIMADYRGNFKSKIFLLILFLISNISNIFI